MTAKMTSPSEISLSATSLSAPFSAAPFSVSVIMVSYMTGPVLFEALAAIVADPDIAELILVDNGNTPEARAEIGTYLAAQDKIRIFQGHGNIGFAAACNYGASLARGDLLLCLNPDAILMPGAARAMAQAGERLEPPWVVGGQLQNMDGREQRGARRGALTPKSAFLGFTGLDKLFGLRGIHREGEPLPDAPMPMPVVSGACLMMDRASYAAMGGFDAGYFLHVEDIDLCHRVRRAGGRVIFAPGAIIRHYGSTSDVPSRIVEYHKVKGFIRYFWRYSPTIWGRALTVLAAPFIAAAIMGRVGILALRQKR